MGLNDPLCTAGLGVALVGLDVGKEGIREVKPLAAQLQEPRDILVEGQFGVGGHVVEVPQEFDRHIALPEAVVAFPSSVDGRLDPRSEGVDGGGSVPGDVLGHARRDRLAGHRLGSVCGIQDEREVRTDRPDVFQGRQSVVVRWTVVADDAVGPGVAG
nr:hypothetical protein [Halobellus sp. DFY28]